MDSQNNQTVRMSLGRTWSLGKYEFEKREIEVTFDTTEEDWESDVDANWKKLEEQIAAKEAALKGSKGTRSTKTKVIPKGRIKY